MNQSFCRLIYIKKAMHVIETYVIDTKCLKRAPRSIAQDSVDSYFDSNPPTLSHIGYSLAMREFDSF
ncbi:hypothetical protein BY458DRAFT_498273, partial [Sporodiniella umbellata]